MDANDTPSLSPITPIARRAGLSTRAFVPAALRGEIPIKLTRIGRRWFVQRAAAEAWLRSLNQPADLFA
jgi:hypothetical protein